MNFDVPIDAEMISQGILRLQDHNGVVLRVAARFENNGKRIVIDPTELLERGSRHKLQIRPLRSATGNSMWSGVYLEFTTVQP